MFPDTTIKKKYCINDFLKRGDNLKSKGVSPNDVKSHIFTAEVISIDESSRKEFFYTNRFSHMLSQFNMICDILAQLKEPMEPPQRLLISDQER